MAWFTILQTVLFAAWEDGEYKSLDYKANLDETLTTGATNAPGEEFTGKLKTTRRNMKVLIRRGNPQRYIKTRTQYHQPTYLRKNLYLR